jgi:DNA repair protein RadD
MEIGMQLRPYQEQVLSDLWKWFETHDEGDPLIEASVGAGKSLLIAEMCRRAIAEYPEPRILMVVHVRELIQQNLQKLLQVWPTAPVGVYSASVGSRQLGRAITYATIGSIAKRAHQLGQVDLMLVDECHLISSSEATMYRKLIDELRRYCPAMRVVGWTGTAFRGDGIWLTQQGVFSHVAARVTMAQLLKDGYLAPLTPAPVDTRVDTSGVATSGGDYVVTQLAKATDKADLVRQACAELARLAADRKKWLVFAVTVDHAHHLAAELRNEHGIACAVISAKTPKAEREATIAAFKRGGVRALVNVAVLTTGFDAPEVDCIALLRATKSPVLYVQIAGRGMRTADGKTDCLWLDFTDTTYTLGPVDAVKGRAKPKPFEGERVAPFRTCDECGNPAPASAPSCPTCGAVFPEPDRINHFAQASVAAVLSTGPQWHSITRVSYRHNPGKDGKPDTLRVDYWSGIKVAALEWVCIEHPAGWARSKACAWWNTRGGTPVPETIEEALERTDELREPARIQTRQNGKYAEIVNLEWQPDRAAA